MRNKIDRVNLDPNSTGIFDDVLLSIDYEILQHAILLSFSHEKSKLIRKFSRYHLKFIRKDSH